MSVQLDRWAGSFGDEYTARNVVDWRDRIGAWWTMLKGLERDLSSVLELGCSTGHNLRCIYQLIPERLAVTGCLYGVEPNARARDRADTESFAWLIVDDLSKIDGRKRVRGWPLIFTCGVLIHVPPDELDRTLRTIHDLSRRYILCIEYYAEQETAVEYRGLPDMLWKRNWPQEYEGRFPDLRLIRSGFWGKDSGFDDCHWWLWEKP